jgi:regulator of chromosome condensation
VTPAAAAKEPEAKAVATNGKEAEEGKDAVIEEEEQDVSMSEAKTPNKTRGKRPRVSDVAEDVESTPATTRTLRPRAKSPAAETPARASRGTKRPRVSAVAKPLKQGLNGLATPFASIDDPKLQHFTFKPPYSLLSELDPRKSENQPLSAFIFGTGDNGQFGLGVEQTDEIPRPRLHDWFKVNSVPPAQTNGSEENGEAQESKPKALLGPHGIEQVACGGLHSLALDSEGKV